MTVEACTTEGYLLVRVWDIYGRMDWSPDCELDFMSDVQAACHTANQTLDEVVDWDENDSVFDYEYADASGSDSLARVIYDALVDRTDLRESVRAWVRRTSLPLKKDPSDG